MNRRNFSKAVLSLGVAAASAQDRPSAAAPALPPITFNRQSWLINGAPAFLVSGEFHYFRVPKADWKRRMALLREAGGNAIATYVPWILHEPSEGQFTFRGMDGALDLEEFLDTARSAGLYVTPGLVLTPTPS